MSALNPLPVVNESSKPNAQGTKKILLGNPMVHLPPPPPPTAKKDPSALVRTLSSTNLLADAEKEEGKTKPRKKPTCNNSKKATNPKVIQTPGLRQVMSALAKELRLSEHITKVDNKGTKWLGKTQEDDPPLKLSQIPTDLRHNEVEFVHWQPFNGKFSLSHLLYTAKGSKYWVNAPAVKWLEAAKHEGKVPGVCTFVVKNTRDEGLQYGFRYEDEEVATPKDDILDESTIVDLD